METETTEVVKNVSKMDKVKDGALEQIGAALVTVVVTTLLPAVAKAVVKKFKKTKESETVATKAA